MPHTAPRHRHRPSTKSPRKVSGRSMVQCSPSGHTCKRRRTRFGPCRRPIIPTSGSCMTSSCQEGADIWVWNTLLREVIGPFVKGVVVRWSDVYLPPAISVHGWDIDLLHRPIFFGGGPIMIRFQNDQGNKGPTSLVSENKVLETRHDLMPKKHIR